MPQKIGIDIVHIPRISQMSQTALDRTFTQSELKNKDPAHLAGIFAAKEAIFKAFGEPPSSANLSWTDIEITTDPKGKPHATITKFRFSQNKSEIIDISISHDGDYAVGMALVDMLKSFKPHEGRH